jgi:indole-3-glycerol phosphate synthase
MDKPGILEQILSAKRDEIAQLGRAALPTPPPRRRLKLRRAAGAPLGLMAEIKRRSPSAGPLSVKLSVAERARAYERAGACMVSVLCDRQFFAGDYTHLAEARAACSLPLLCKDFILHERQLDAARGWGADAALLIVRCLSPERLAELLQAAEQRDIAALVEVTTAEEARLALDCGAELVGVNARDLATLKVDVQQAADLLASLPETVTSVHLSGLASEDAVQQVAASSAHAALIGEALMRQDDPEPLLRRLVAAAGPT